MKDHKEYPLSQKQMAELHHLAQKMDKAETKLWSSISRLQNLEATLTVLQEAKTLFVEATKRIMDKREARTSCGVDSSSSSSSNSNKSNNNNDNNNNINSRTTDDSSNKCLQNLPKDHSDKDSNVSSTSSSVSSDKNCQADNQLTQNNSSFDTSPSSNYSDKEMCVPVSKSYVDEKKGITLSESVTDNPEKSKEKTDVSKKTSSSSDVDKKHKISSKDHDREFKRKSSHKISKGAKGTEKREYIMSSKKIKHDASVQNIGQCDNINIKNSSSSNGKNRENNNVSPKNDIRTCSKKSINSNEKKHDICGINNKNNNNYYAQNYDFSCTSKNFKSSKECSFKAHFEIDNNRKLKTNSGVTKKVIRLNLKTRKVQSLTSVDPNCAKENLSQSPSVGDADGCVETVKSPAEESLTGQVQTLAGIKTWELPAILMKTTDPKGCNAKQKQDLSEQPSKRMTVLGSNSDVATSSTLMPSTEEKPVSTSVCDTAPIPTLKSKLLENESRGKPIPTWVNSMRGAAVPRRSLIYPVVAETQTPQDETFGPLGNPTVNCPLPDVPVPFNPLVQNPNCVYVASYQAPVMMYPPPIIPLNYTAAFQQPNQVLQAPSLFNYSVHF